MSSQQNTSKDLPSVPGDARIDPEIPRSAKEAPLTGVEAAKDTSFKDAVAGHAKYFAGKVFGNDKEVQQGAARLRGEEDTLPAGGTQQNVIPGNAGHSQTSQPQHQNLSHQQQPQSQTQTAPALGSGAAATGAAVGAAGAGAAGVAGAGHHHAGAHHEASTAGREPSTQTQTIPAGIVPTSSTGAGTGSGVGSAVHTAPAGATGGATSGADKPRQETSAFH